MPDLNGALLENTIQSQVHRDDYAGIDILPLLVRAGELIPLYWSPARDYELGRFWMKVDHISSAFSMFASKIASIPLRIEPKDPSIKSHARQADNLTALINTGSDFGQGWAASFMVRWAIELITQDNGPFAEIVGDAPMTTDPITGYRCKDYSKPRVNFYGLNILDSQRCTRTSNPVYPVVYQDVEGGRYRLHYSRVMYTSSLPSNRIRMNRVGLCALSRCISTAQHLYDIAVMEQEELGSRPKRRMLIAEQGISATEVQNAFQAADIAMDNQGLRRFSKNVVIGPKDGKGTTANPIKIEVKELHSALIGEDKERSITLGMFLIALALNIPPRWLWPATSTGATKADAMFQHIAGMGGGIGHLLMIMKSLLGGDELAEPLGKPIGPQFDVVFDYQDDEQDRQQAEIRKTRSEVTEKYIATGVWTERVARQQAMDAGDITEQQFEDMELGDGRLPDGQDVVNLFYSTDPTLQEMLSISVGDILNTEANDRDTVLSAIADKEIELRATLAAPSRPKEFDLAKQAFAALQALKKLYLQPTMAEQQEGLDKIEQQRNASQTSSEGNDSAVKPKPEISSNSDRGDNQGSDSRGDGRQRTAIPANGNRQSNIV